MPNDDPALNRRKIYKTVPYSTVISNLDSIQFQPQPDLEDETPLRTNLEAEEEDLWKSNNVDSEINGNDTLDSGLGDMDSPDPIQTNETKIRKKPAKPKGVKKKATTTKQTTKVPAGRKLSNSSQAQPQIDVGNEAPVGSEIEAEGADLWRAGNIDSDVSGNDAMDSGLADIGSLQTIKKKQGKGTVKPKATPTKQTTKVPVGRKLSNSSQTQIELENGTPVRVNMEKGGAEISKPSNVDGSVSRNDALSSGLGININININSSDPQQTTKKKMGKGSAKQKETIREASLSRASYVSGNETLVPPESVEMNKMKPRQSKVVVGAKPPMWRPVTSQPKPFNPDSYLNVD